MQKQKNTPLLKESVEKSLETYFADLADSHPADIYKMVMQEVELPLLAFIMKKTEGNQCKAAELLGLNRGTLRKKLKQYQL